MRGRVNVMPGGGIDLDTRELSCACATVPCRYCRVGAVRRPLTEWAVPSQAGRHAPWFRYLLPCEDCQARGLGPRVN